MSRHYSMPESERSAYTLPDIEVFQMTAREFAEVEAEQLADLRRELESFGFSARAISHAFRNVIRKN